MTIYISESKFHCRIRANRYHISVQNSILNIICITTEQWEPCHLDPEDHKPPLLVVLLKKKWGIKKKRFIIRVELHIVYKRLKSIRTIAIFLCQLNSTQPDWSPMLTEVMLSSLGDRKQFLYEWEVVVLYQTPLCSVLSEDVCVAFSLEASMLYGRWHVKWNESDQRVRLNWNRGMVPWIRFV